MKLLDTGTSNTKIRKTQKSVADVRVASLSLMPDTTICPSCQIAGCINLCLKESGRGRFDNVAQARQSKSDYFHANRDEFLSQLRKELTNFVKVCDRDNLKPVARLNVLSDIQYERHGIPQSFPEITFYDYTKLAKRIGNTPDNYSLMFSYSKAPAYQKQVDLALQTDAPIAVVFDKIPTDPSYRFLGRCVIDGDKSDLVNVKAGPVIIGLKYKRTKATDAMVNESDFVINTNLIASAS